MTWEIIVAYFLFPIIIYRKSDSEFPETNKYTNRQVVCSVIALPSNEYQAEGEVPLELSGSCAGPVTAQVPISSYRYSFLH